jgi:glycosyltransferase involved in cell wall biosynthesis
VSRRPAPSCDSVTAVVSAFAADDFPGGAERYAATEAELLAAGRRVVHVSSSPPGGSPVEEIRIGGWLRRLYDPHRRDRAFGRRLAFHALMLFNPVVFAEALSAFRRLRPQVVHTHNLLGLSPSVWLAARLSGARVVHTHHDLWLLCERSTMTGKDGRYCAEVTPMCGLCRTTRVAKRAQARLVSRETFPSAWLRERLRRRGDVIRPCVIAPARAGAAGDPPTVLFLGQLVPSKGVDTLLDAFREVAGEVRLVVAGTGPLDGLVRHRASEDPRISYAGQVDEAGRERLLAGASLLAIPSRGPDASPLVFFEALAAGVPAVVSAVGGLGELAELGSAVVVPSEDPGALAEAIAGMLDGNRLRDLRARAVALRDLVSAERFLSEIEAVLAGAEARGRHPTAG